MATATYTCSDYLEVPRGGIPGVISRSGTVNWSATSTVGDIAFLTKIPHGAVIVDLYEYHTTGASAQALSFGLLTGGAAGGGANASLFIASGAQGARNNLSVQAGIGWQVSVSDTDPNRFATLIAKVESGSTTTSLMLAFTVTYRVDKTPD